MLLKLLIDSAVALRGFNCAHCFFRISEEQILCQACKRDLECFEARKRSLSAYAWPVQALYEWWGESPVGAVIRSLKGCNDPAWWLPLARRLELKAIQERGLGFESKFDFIVPSPSRRRGEGDHALGLAKSLSGLLSTPILDCLGRSGSGTQKVKSRSERAGLEHILLPGHRGVEKSSILFVDDLVTTGGTARAAHLALGRPKKFEIWTIGCRPLHFRL